LAVIAGDKKNMPIKELGGKPSTVNILGEDPSVQTVEVVEKDPLAAANRREDEALISATGTLPAEEDKAAAFAGISMETQQAIMSGVQAVLSDPEQDPQTAAEKLEDIQRKGALVPLSDYWTLTRQATAEDNPHYGALQVETTLKLQYLMETLEDRISQERPEKFLGRAASWFDRYVIRGSTVGAVEGITLKGSKTGDKFLNALSGNMSLEAFQDFLDTDMDEMLEEGIFFKGSYHALKDLYDDAMRRGDDAGVTVEAIMGTVDLVSWLFPLAKGATSLTRKVGKALANSPTASTQAGITGGHKAATETAEAIAKVTDDPENLASMGPPHTDPVGDKAPVRPLLEAAQDAHTHVDVFENVKDYVRRAMGSSYDEAALLGYVNNKAKALSKVINRNVADYFFDSATNVLKVRFGGVHKGTPVSKKLAEKILEDLPQKEFTQARIVPADLTGKKFFVEVESIVDVDKFVKLKHTPVEAVGHLVQRLATRVLGNRFTAGSYLRDAEELTSKALRAETVTTKLKEALAHFGKPLTKLKSSQIEDIGEIVQDIQSGAEAGRRSWLTTEQFVEKYEDKIGHTPSKKVIEGYHALVELSDYAYVAKASMMIREMHRQGFRGIRIEGHDIVAGHRVSSLPSDVDHIVDATTGRVIPVSEYKGPMSNIYKLDFDVEDITFKSRYVVDTDTVRPLEATDVLGYNAGGSRINPEANYFISFDVDGKVVRVALSTFSEKEAAKAVGELQTLVNAFRSGTLTDDMVLANNSWNRTLETAEDLENLAIEEGWDLTQEINVTQRGRDSGVFSGANQDVFIAGGSLEEFALFSGRRNDTPLLHYGGARTYNDNPVNAVLNQVNSVSRRLAYETYNDEAIVSLGKAVRDMVGRKEGYTTRDYYNEMESLLRKDEANPLIQTLLERKRIFELRTGVRTEGEKGLQKLADSMTEGLYNLTGLKFKVGSPEARLTGFGFFNTFFGDPFQLVLQASQAAAIVAMHPATGMKGAMLGSKLLKSTKLSRGPELDLMMKRMSDHFDIPEDELWELRQTFTDIGRYEIDPESVAEGSIGQASSIHFSKRNLREKVRTTGKAWDTTSKAGLFFFNKGEQIARVTAFGTSALEYRKAFPKGRFTSKQAVSWISDKEQALTLNMTQASKGMAQQGLMKVPTQFYSFMLRTVEGVFVGRNLSRQERIMLAVYLGPSFGLTGVGLGHLATKAGAAMGWEADSTATETLRNGPVEALMDWVFDGDYDVGLASRLSIGDAFVDVLRSFENESLLEALSGAGGGKAGSAAYNVGAGVINVLTGKRHYGTLQLVEGLRENKLLDNAAKLQGLIAHDVYQSKTGKRIEGLDLSLAEKVSVVLGIPLGEVQEYYDLDSMAYGSQKAYRERSKALIPLVNLMWDSIEEGDAGRVNSISKEVEAIIELSNLTEKQKGNLRSQVLQGSKEKTTLDMYFKLIRLGLFDEAKAYVERNRY